MLKRILKVSVQGTYSLKDDEIKATSLYKILGAHQLFCFSGPSN
jgi:hypothetical protein